MAGNGGHDPPNHDLESCSLPTSLIPYMAGAVGFEPTPRDLESRLYGFAYHYSFHYLLSTYSLWSGVHLHHFIFNLGV